MTLVRAGRGGGCALCGAAGAACGHPSTSVPIDVFEEVAVVGGPLRLYEVTMPSGVVATLKLNEADAARLGGVPVDEPMRGVQAVGAVVDEAPPVPEPDVAPAPKARTPRNKRRTAANKEGGGGG